jgi:transmembrane sensor
MSQKEFSKLLDKYLKGECTPEEEELILKWYHRIDSGELKAEDGDRTETELRLWRKIKPGNTDKPTHWIFRIAAVFALFAAIFCIYVIVNNDPVQNQTGYQKSSTTLSDHRLTNASSVIQVHKLADGSEVSLHPGSELRLDENFSEGIRSVHLEGEAFFNVKRDTLHPFVVYSGDVLTKVLGTSFTVKAYPHTDEVAVKVKTGLVSVTAHVSDDRRAEEILLKPNQEAIYNPASKQVKRKLVDAPEIILEKPTLFAMEYDGAPVNKIFEVLEENYGVDIVCDEALFSACVLTTSLTDEGLYERIKIICKAIGAEYAVNDSTIVIQGNGCQ